MEISLKEFKKRILNNEKREHKITNSYGVKDYFKYYRKNRPKDSNYILTEEQYYKIVRLCNLKYLNELFDKGSISLPERMGTLQIRKVPVIKKFKNNKLINTNRVDWDSTLQLWHEDEESFIKKRVIKRNEKYKFVIRYDKSNANYKNKRFYEFRVGNSILKKVNHLATEKEIDAVLDYDNTISINQGNT